MAILRQNVILTGDSDCFTAVGSFRIQGWVGDDSTTFDVTLADNHRQEVISSRAVDNVFGAEGDPLFSAKILVDNYSDPGLVQMIMVPDPEVLAVYTLAGTTVDGTCTLNMSWAQDVLYT
jgi:hypothetical protein